MLKTFSRVAVAVLALALGSTVARAQTPESTWDFGLTAGVNVSTFSGSDADDPDWRSDFMGGLSLNFGISDMLSLQPEVLYSRKGAKWTEGGMTAAIKLGYIDIPVLVKFATGTAQQLRPVFFVGPSIGLLVSCDGSITSLGSGDCKDEFKSTDFGVVGGVGFDVGAIGVFVRFQQGLTKLPDDGDGDLFNRVVTIGGRYSFSGMRR